MNYLYDGSFEGFLTVVFEAFRNKTDPAAITPSRPNTQIPFGESVTIPPDKNHADRVWTGLERKTNARSARLVSIAFRAQEPETEMMLWRYLKKVFTSVDPCYYQNMLDEDVYGVMQMARRVNREVHRFHGFVRFQKTLDGVYFAAVDPDHDIVQLLTSHFKARYADQAWVIYDTKRNYGVYFDSKEFLEVVLTEPAFDRGTGTLNATAKDHDQDHYVRLWQAYYNSINISARKNHKLMTAAMPRRYWKYLPEKDKR